MSNYFILNLDLDPPDLEIIAPNYTTPSQINEIKILSNEKLSQFQEIYSIDSLGRRKDYSFEFKETYYEGKIVFNEILGEVVLYAKLKDEGMNESLLYSKIIEVLKDSVLYLDCFVLERNTKSFVLEKDLTNKIKFNKIETLECAEVVSISEKEFTTQIEVIE